MTISLYDTVENTMGKGKNAGYQHLLLFQQCFQKTSSSGSLKVRTLWYRINPFPTITPFDAPGKQAFRKHLGKRRNCL